MLMFIIVKGIKDEPVRLFQSLGIANRAEPAGWQYFPFCWLGSDLGLIQSARLLCGLVGQTF